VPVSSRAEMRRASGSSAPAIPGVRGSAFEEKGLSSGPDWESCYLEANESRPEGARICGIPI